MSTKEVLQIVGITVGFLLLLWICISAFKRIKRNKMKGERIKPKDPSSENYDHLKWALLFIAILVIVLAILIDTYYP